MCMCWLGISLHGLHRCLRRCPLPWLDGAECMHWLAILPAHSPCMYTTTPPLVNSCVHRPRLICKARVPPPNPQHKATGDAPPHTESQATGNASGQSLAASGFNGRMCGARWAKVPIHLHPKTSTLRQAMRMPLCACARGAAHWDMCIMRPPRRS